MGDMDEMATKHPSNAAQRDEVPMPLALAIICAPLWIILATVLYGLAFGEITL
jgi:hypothetical protein